MLRNIVIDLDVLLDTRAGTLRRIIPEKEVEELVNSEKYRNRDHERMWELCSITEQQWKDGWALRDVVTISKSTMTLAMIDIVKMIADLNSVVAGNNPGLSDVRFLLNTYPYTLTPKQKAMIASATQYNLATTCEVMTISLDYSRLSPAHCKDRNIIMMLLYDITKYAQDCFPDDGGWAIDNLPTPNEELTIVTPRIIRDVLSTRDEIQQLEVQLPRGVNDFTIGMELFQLLFGLEFVNTSYVCEMTKEVRERIEQGYKNARGDNSDSNDTITTFDDVVPDVIVPKRNVFRRR